MIWMQTASGRAFDLSEPRANLVDFAVDIPEALARVPRFSGHVRAGAYSVAQHSVVGADAILRETGMPDLAAAFLLHDAHEAYVGDIATPVAEALRARGAALTSLPGMRPGFGEGIVREAIDSLKHDLDAAIHERAGLPWPLPRHVADSVKAWDLRILATERQHLLGRAPKPWAPIVEQAQPIRLSSPLKVWPWPRAADEFRQRLANLLPAAL